MFELASISRRFVYFFFFFLLTRGWRISAGLNKSSSRSSIHLQSSDFPARRNDQTNLCDRDTSVEKVGRRLKSKFKSHPPPTRRPLVPRLFRFILQLMKHGGGMCVGALVPRTSCLLFSDNFRPRSFFFPFSNEKSSQSSINRGNRYSSLYRGTDYLSRTACGSALWIVLRIIRACHC